MLPFRIVCREVNSQVSLVVVITLFNFNIWWTILRYSPCVVMKIRRHYKDGVYILDLYYYSFSVFGVHFP